MWYIQCFVYIVSGKLANGLLWYFAVFVSCRSCLFVVVVIFCLCYLLLLVAARLFTAISLMLFFVLPRVFFVTALVSAAMVLPLCSFTVMVFTAMVFSAMAF